MKFKTATLDTALPEAPYGFVPYPHCDTWVLHSPGACQFCDDHDDWQRDRVKHGVAFSDTPADVAEAQGLKPCPSTIRRTAELRDRWPGNRPS